MDINKIKPFYIRIFCVHTFTGGARRIVTKHGKIRHARICIKCGQRNYID